MKRILTAIRTEMGQVLVMTALFLPVVIGFVGLSVDAGMIMLRRTDQQKAADAAALAGAEFLLSGTPKDSSAESEARAYAAKNGYSGSGVTVNVPPTSGSHTGNATYVEVKVRQTKTTFFMRVLGINSATVSARAVAGLDPKPGNYALIILDKTACEAYDQTSSAVLTINNGSAIDNSSCRTAKDSSAYQGGGSTIQAVCDLTKDPTCNPANLHIDYYNQGRWEQSNNATASPSPSAVGFQIMDPLAAWATAARGAMVLCTNSAGTQPAGCNVKWAPAPAGSKWSQNHNKPQAMHIPADCASPCILQPGVYWGGIKIDGGGDVTFMPGLYVLAGGGETQGGFDYASSANLVGQGVTFYNTNDKYANTESDRKCGAIALQGNGLLSLTAPTIGNKLYDASPDIDPAWGYRDMLFWQATTGDWSNLQNYCQAPEMAMKYTGGSCTNCWTVSGVVYLPKGQLNVAGGGNLGSVQVIVDTFNYSGSNNVTINYTEYVKTARPVVKLVE